MGCASSKDIPASKGQEVPGEQDPIQQSDIKLDLKPQQQQQQQQQQQAAASAKDAKRRVGVSAEATGGGSSNEYKKVLHAKSDEATQHITEATSTNPLFSSLSDLQRADVVAAMREVQTQPGDIVIQQGDVGDDFYVVDSGTYSVLLKQKGNTPVHSYSKGGTFGELSLMYGSPRAATVRCETAGVLFALDRKTFRAIMMEGNRAMLNTSTQFLKSVSMLSPLTDEQRQAIADILEEQVFKAGHVIVKEGDPADSLYFVKEGEAAAFKTGLDGTEKQVFAMQVGSVFGESALQGANSVRQATVKAVTNVKMLKLTRANFTDTLGDLKDVIQQNFNEKVLSSIDLFSGLTTSERSLLVESLTEETFAAGDKIIRQNDAGESFYIIKSGTVRVTARTPDGEREEVIKDNMGPGAYFGERALAKSEPRMATVTATSEVACMKVDRETFNKLLGSMSDILQRDMQRREREAAKAQRPKIKMSELKQMTILGVGTFGRVKLVVHTSTNTPYALKCMRKGQVIALKQVEHVMNEKNLLEMCDHPFLLNLAATFQDQDEIYMLLELALGGELFSVLRERIKFDEPTSRFYSACVASAFSYLHDKFIVYRDLKPENLLFDDTGYLRVCDFGFAKLIQDRTWTLCGTPEYLAPEIIQNKGHNHAVDWWAFGILIFEMLSGQPPFCADDPMDIYQKILRNKLAFPSYFSKNVRDLLSKLLVTNPAARLGSLKNKSRDVTSHIFFKNLHWNELTRKEIKAPYIPVITSPTDTSNFEHYDDEGGEDWARFNDRKKDTFAGF
mmetsp:Transcript_18118/g.43343  ORF Transcript_18118/g.43343 Transcript_18118/m.43343 type:complete len:789 (-) Transcript_18118:558-2924(-)